MACSVKKDVLIILVALILSVSIPISTSHSHRHRDRKERRRSNQGREEWLRDHLCSKTNESNECWKILKPESYRFVNSGGKAVAGVVIDLAIAKSNEIHDKLNSYYSDSRNDELKAKYISCSKNYNDINRNLVVARRDLDSDHHRNIPVQINDANDELNNCKREFNKDSFDPAHITDRNKELGLYLEIVWVASARLEIQHHH